MANVQYYDVILKPVVTEKSMNAMAEKKYTFLVHPDANKTMIKEAVERMFEGTKVAKVNTMNCEGKNRRRGMVTGKTAKTKKAIVQLTEDSKDIEILAGLEFYKEHLHKSCFASKCVGNASEKHYRLCVSDDTIMKTSKGEKQWELRHITHIHLPEEI